MKLPTMSFQTITPKIATEWLQSDINRGNRTLRESHIQYLAREMAGGRWDEVTHQGIAFATTGRLLDGQHRLSAVIRSGCTIKIMVTEGLNESTYKKMDGGVKRANHDVLHLVDDVKENHLICQALRHYIVETTPNRHPSPGVLEDEFLGDKFNAWVWIGKEANKLPKNLRNAGVYAALAVYYYIKPEKAAEFTEGYRTGAGLPANSPILNLRNRVLGCTSSSECDYWFSVSLTRAHLNNTSLRLVYEASEDMLGCKNTSRAVQVRSEVRRKSKKCAQSGV